MTPFKVAAILALLLGGAESAQAVQLVTDGSFENIALGAIPAGTTSGVWHFGPYGISVDDGAGGVSSPIHTGQRAAYLRAYNGTYVDISQSIAFPSALDGQIAVLTFWADNPDSNNNLTVSLGNQTYGTIVLGASGYQEYTYDFTLGTSPQTLLFEFQSGSSDFPNLYLDDVSLTVPEPASMALLGVGLLGLGLIRRKFG